MDRMTKKQREEIEERRLVKLFAVRYHENSCFSKVDECNRPMCDFRCGVTCTCLEVKRITAEDFERFRSFAFKCETKYCDIIRQNMEIFVERGYLQIRIDPFYPHGKRTQRLKQGMMEKICGYIVQKLSVITSQRRCLFEVDGFLISTCWYPEVMDKPIAILAIGRTVSYKDSWIKLDELEGRLNVPLDHACEQLFNGLNGYESYRTVILLDIEREIACYSDDVKSIVNSWHESKGGMVPDQIWMLTSGFRYETARRVI